MVWLLARYYRPGKVQDLTFQLPGAGSVRELKMMLVERAEAGVGNNEYSFNNYGPYQEVRFYKVRIFF